MEKELYEQLSKINLIRSPTVLLDRTRTLVALLPRSKQGTLRNALDFCAFGAKIKRIPKAPFTQRGSKAANVACPI
jgi:hypothetical protein